ncbi:AraC family transcriptional regulator [Tenacibaculum tangerinum]|uniref:AraC family transcriptional regulator n=1 Tax=Tenacibaculum tangerinum TaxID=3038772 RepID=A0ABY8L5S1_9FLAO|nr:AraC family transcriptional regulator [Tenacibaculum tangerinum]WGH75374.1 AraC family transcriptional regulator [Tenacibaculum tangerinum]
MRIYLKFDANAVLKNLLVQQLNTLNLEYTLHNTQEIIFNKELSLAEKTHVQELLEPFNIYITNDLKLNIIQRIKICIDNMLKDEDAVKITASHYLSDKLNYSYAYLSNLFSEATYTSIENYIILRKVDLVKDFLVESDLTLTEIAYKLNYSSVAHLSSQFKKTTGLTTSTFKRIIEKRNQTNI